MSFVTMQCGGIVESATRHTKGIQQSCRVQDQHAKTSYISKHFSVYNMKKEIKKTIPFKTASKRVKYLGINLT